MPFIHTINIYYYLSMININQQFDRQDRNFLFEYEYSSSWLRIAHNRLAARVRILRCIPSQVTSSIYRSVRLTITTRFVDSHNALVALKKSPRDAALRSSYNRQRRVSRTLLQSTSARLPTGSIKATRSVTTLQTFEICAPRKMWPSNRRTDTSLPSSPFLCPSLKWHLLRNCQRTRLT